MIHVKTFWSMGKKFEKDLQTWLNTLPQPADVRVSQLCDGYVVVIVQPIDLEQFVKLFQELDLTKE